MPIDRSDFDSISEIDLQELLTAQVPEGLTLDYKRDPYGNADSDKRELLKDVSSFANSQGGHLVIGIAEQNGVPTAIDGLNGINQDDEVLRLEQIIRSGIEPRIVDVRTRAIDLANGNCAIVIRIHTSWNPPHRVSFGGRNSFWLRNSAGKHEASIEELRNLFTLSSTAMDKIRSFRHERLEIIANGEGHRPLRGDGRLILHIAPLHAFTTTEKIDLSVVHTNHQIFMPIGATNTSPKYNFEGLRNERSGDDNYGYTQIFRNGIIEATKGNIIHERTPRPEEIPRFIPASHFEGQIFQHLPSYINGLQNIGVQPPLIIMLSLAGVNRIDYSDEDHARYEFDDDLILFDRPQFLLPECVLENYGSDTDYHMVVKPAFDALWNAIGKPHDPFFNDEDIWINPRQQRGAA